MTTVTYLPSRNGENNTGRTSDSLTADAAPRGTPTVAFSVKRKLILFDIDGTILDSGGGVGLRALQDGFAEAFPSEAESLPFPELELGGATDRGLASFVFDFFGLPHTTENEERFFASYVSHLEPALVEAARSDRLRKLPGISPLVDHLSDSRHEIGLLTGNIRRGAELKLAAIGFDFAEFRVGAFGDDHADRNRLGPIAIDRAGKEFGTVFDAEDEVIIIGDTLKDISCARACGAKVIAVATGSCDSVSLENARPDYLFQDLSDFEEVITEAGLD